MSHADPGGDQDSPVRPLLAGDWVDGRQVVGFAWDGVSGERRSTHLDDRLLLDGDQELTSPPSRPVPQTADGAELKAIMPPGDLPECRRLEADSIDATMRWRADALLNAPGAMWQPVIRPLFVGVLAAGHRLWLSGGAAREVVSGAALREVNDLDLAGTVPTGRFSDIAYQTLRATQMSEYRVRVDPESLVCSIVTPMSLTPKEEQTVIEYRGLNLGGFGFPAVGSRMEEDSRHRDLSFNTLFYDVLAHVVIDASGNGLTDLRDGRRFRPQVTAESRMSSALVLVRALKFAIRWYDTMTLELEPLLEWSSTLPADFADSFSAEEWVGLTETYETYVVGRPELQRRFADRFSGPARSFVDKLIEGAE